MDRDRLSVVTWNVQGMAPGWHRRRTGLARVLSGLRPDAVALQECAWRLRHQASQLAALTGIHACRAGTLGLLTRDRVSHRDYRLPARARGGSKRLLIADVNGVTVITLHMPLDAGVRARYAHTVVGLAREATGPVIVCGDFNERPDGPAVSLLRDAGFMDAWDGSGGETWPVPRLNARIDFVLLWGSIRPERAELIQSSPPASDHLGLSVVVRAR